MMRCVDLSRGQRSEKKSLFGEMIMLEYQNQTYLFGANESSKSTRTSCARASFRLFVLQKTAILIRWPGNRKHCRFELTPQEWTRTCLAPSSMFRCRCWTMETPSCCSEQRDLNYDADGTGWQGRSIPNSSIGGSKIGKPASSIGPHCTPTTKGGGASSAAACRRRRRRRTC